MNSRLDWLVLSDYYSIYVTTAPPSKAKGKSNMTFPFVLQNFVGFCCNLSILQKFVNSKVVT